MNLGSCSPPRCLCALLALFLTVFLWLPALPAHTHALQPAYLNIIQRSGQQFEVSWKVPFAGESSIVPLSEEPEFPQSCEDVTSRAAYQSPAAVLKRWTISCGEAGLDRSDCAYSRLRSRPQ